MKLFRATNPFGSHFRTKIFTIFSLLIVSITLAFTVFLFNYQSNSLTEKIISKGELLADMLAHSSRLGVFSENADQLAMPINGIMNNREVMAVAVFSTDGRILAFRNREGSSDQAIMELTGPRFDSLLNGTVPKLRYLAGDRYAFLARITQNYQVSREDSALFNTPATNTAEQVLGFVRVDLNRQPLQEELRELLLESILIGMVFLVITLLLAYGIAEKITKPLNALSKGVEAFGRGEEYRPIPVEGNDELDHLADAFNNLAATLRERESEKEELSAQLRQSQKMEAVGTLAGGIAHDFNNILTVINGYGSLLKLEISAADKHWNYADQIVKAGERAANLTSRLLAFSRKQIIHPQVLDLNSVIKNIEQMLTRLITEDIELRIHLEAENPFVLADEGQLDQVLINLVTNARDAMPQGGKLTISTGIVSLDEDFARKHNLENGTLHVELKVSDNGIGMTEATNDRIFDPFYTTKEVGKGTGLGLAMIYGIVKQHGGIISVNTEPDKGTAISIFMPLVERNAEKPIRETKTVPRGNGETILLAEDDSAVMGLLKGILERHNYVVIPATNGEEAIENFSINREDINLAILDVIMPKRNGKEVRDALMEMRPGIKTIFISGYTQDVIDWKSAAEEGMHLLTKPVQTDEFLIAIRDLLDSR
jgi:signal transduction histidine kinase/ActR/RegA family two-component response regulator